MASGNKNAGNAQQNAAASVYLLENLHFISLFVIDDNYLRL